MPQLSSLGLFVMLCFNTHIYKEFNSLNEGDGLLKQRLERPKQSHVARSLGTQLFFLICGTELLCYLDISFHSGL